MGIGLRLWVRADGCGCGCGWVVIRLTGDFGFDPLNLGADPKNLAWYVQAELVHARFAMLGAAGILLPEIGTKMGMLNVPVRCDLPTGKQAYTVGSFFFTWFNLCLGTPEPQRMSNQHAPTLNRHFRAVGKAPKAPR